MATIISTFSPSSCSRKCFEPLRWKMSADSSLIKIKLGSPIKYSSPAVVSIDQNNNCKLVIKNCTPYNVTLEHTRANRTRGRFIDTFASVYNEIQEIFPNVKRKQTSVQIWYCAKMQNTSFYSNIKSLLASTNMILAWQKTLHIKFIWKWQIQSTENSSKILEGYHEFIEQTLE